MFVCLQCLIAMNDAILQIDYAVALEQWYIECDIVALNVEKEY